MTFRRPQTPSTASEEDEELPVESFRKGSFRASLRGSLRGSLSSLRGSGSLSGRPKGSKLQTAPMPLKLKAAAARRNKWLFWRTRSSMGERLAISGLLEGIEAAKPGGVAEEGSSSSSSSESGSESGSGGG